MFFRALTVSSFILIAWLTLESTKLKSLSIEANNRAVTLEQHLRALQQVSLKNQSMIRQQLTQQNDLLVLEQKVLNEMNAKISTLPKKNTLKPTLAKQQTKKKEAPKQTSAEDIVKRLSQRLVVIDEYQQDEELSKSSELLTAFKQEFWDLRKHKSIGKGKTMAILSSIDITLKKWEDGDPSQTTESIKNAIEKIASVEGASQ